MRILLLTPALPYPAHQGGALRNHGIIRCLAGHDVTLLSFHDAGGNYAPLESLCAGVITVPPPPRGTRDRLRDLLLSDQPDLARRLESRAFCDTLETLLRTHKFDAIQFEGLEMGIYLPLARALQPGARLVYDAHNAEGALQAAIAEIERGRLRRLPARLYSHIQARRITRFEQRVCASADAVIAVSDEDAALLRPFRTDGRVFVLPNGIVADEYAPAATGALDLGEHALVFTGKMDYRPNVDAMLWFAESVLPHIRERVPDVRLTIVGQKPHPRLQGLANGESIALTGWVEQVQPFLHAASVYVAPLRMGSGTRLKLLEAMAAGRAIVATSAAAAGLCDEARAAMQIADGAAPFASSVVALLQQPAQRQRLGSEARAAVRQYYDWAALRSRLLQVYQALELVQMESSAS
jgi:glycosyltransferase involved in cell wall biosynthesis